MNEQLLVVLYNTHLEDQVHGNTQMSKVIKSQLSC